MNQDIQHLKLLSIFHYVVGGIAALLACIPIIHLVVGIAAIAASSEAPPRAFIGWIFCIIVALALILIGWAFAACAIATGRFLAQRAHYMFCLVMGCVECIFIPFGTVLGVFTILVLMRPSVKRLFGLAVDSECRSEALV